MRIIKPYAEIISPADGESVLRHIEICGRVCYKSEEKITQSSAHDFVRKIIQRGHESVLEHVCVTVRFVCDRGVSHEIVRHRIASYSQESTRYCNYNNENEITVIRPFEFWEDTEIESEWEISVEQSETAYMALIERGISPQWARSVLPNSLKTEVVMTANLREWRHFFRLRTAPAAHPQMREITIPLLKEFQEKIPVVFDDILQANKEG